MLTATLAKSGAAALGDSHLLAHHDDEAYAQLMAHTVPHPEHGAVVIRPGDSGLVFHPLRGIPIKSVAAGIKTSIPSSLTRMDGNGEAFIIADRIRVNPLSARMEASRSRGVFFSSHASVALPFGANGSDADSVVTLSPNTLHLSDDSHAFISLQDGGRIFSGQPEIVIIRNGYGVILTSDAEGNIICSGHFLIGRRDDFNGRLGNVNVLNNLVVGATAAFDPTRVSHITHSMTDEITAYNFDQRFAENVGTNIGSALFGKLQSGLVIGVAEITAEPGGDMFRVLVIKAHREDVAAEDRKIVLGNKEALRELTMKFGYTSQATILPTALFETAAAFARAVGETR